VDVRWLDDEGPENLRALLLALASPPPLRDHRCDPDDLIPMFGREAVDLANLLIAAF